MQQHDHSPHSSHYRLFSRDARPLEQSEARRGEGPSETFVSLIDIYHDSVVDGEGLRTVIFFAGCPHRCPGCHNRDSWNIWHGKLLSVNDVVTEVTRNPLTNVTISGGEPFFQAESLVPLVKAVKALGKHIWCYSGFTLAQLQNGTPAMKEALRYIDVLVDGPFVAALRDETLAFRGSSNQCIHRLTV